MNRTQRLLAIAALSIVGSVHADDADGSQYGIQVQSTRSAADVRAEARSAVRITNGSTGVIGVIDSRSSTRAIREEAAMAARAGNTPRGEFGPM